MNEQYNPGCFPTFNQTLGAVKLLHCVSISKQTGSGKCVANTTTRLKFYTTTTTIIIIIMVITTIIMLSTIHILAPTLHLWVGFEFHTTIFTIHTLTPTLHISHISNSFLKSSSSYHEYAFPNTMHLKCCPLLFTHYTQLQISTLPLPLPPWPPWPSMISTATQTHNIDNKDTGPVNFVNKNQISCKQRKV